MSSHPDAPPLRAPHRPCPDCPAGQWGERVDRAVPPAAQLNALRFTDPEVEAAFRHAYLEAALPWFRFNLLLAMLCFGLWTPLDPLFAASPEAARKVAAIRFGVIFPTLVAVLLSTRSAGFARWGTAAQLLSAVVSGAGLIAMMVAGGPLMHDRYFASLVIIAMAYSACPGLRFCTATAFIWLLATGYELAALGLEGTTPMVVNNMLMLAAANVVSMSASYSTERHLRAEFLHRKLIASQGLALQVALREAERRRREADHVARIDPLTALANRRAFFEAAEAGPPPAAVLLIDIDHFKAVNDRLGHLTGDLVLRVVADRIRAGLRAGDLACRFGGEEFAVLLPEAEPAEAAAVAERLRRAVAACGPPAVTISIGVAAADGVAPPPTIDRMLEHADAALYAAKQAGRDRVRVWGALPTPPPDRACA